MEVGFYPSEASPSCLGDKARCVGNATTRPREGVERLSHSCAVSKGFLLTCKPSSAGLDILTVGSHQSTDEQYDERRSLILCNLDHIFRRCTWRSKKKNTTKSCLLTRSDTDYCVPPIRRWDPISEGRRQWRHSKRSSEAYFHLRAGHVTERRYLLNRGESLSQSRRTGGNGFTGEEREREIRNENNNNKYFEYQFSFTQKII